MSVPFKEFRAIYPPHPALSWRPENLHSLRGFVSQYKYDDWRVLIYFYPNGTIRLYSRKKHVLPIYRPPEFLLEELRELRLAPRKFHVLDGGLLHYRTSRLKNTIVLWDVLVQSNEYLVGDNYRDRYRRLTEICGNPDDPVRLDGLKVGWKVGSHLWLAPILVGNPKDLFKEAQRVPEIEGLILKKLDAPLRRADRMEGNASWQIRIRKLAQ